MNAKQRVKMMNSLDAECKSLSVLADRHEKAGELDEMYQAKKEVLENRIKIIDLATNNDETDDFSSLEDEINVWESTPMKDKYRTGLNAIDRNFDGGFEKGQLIILAGASGMGKTALTLQILLSVSENHKSCFFSFEMSKHKIAGRLKQDNPTVEQRRNFILTEKGRDISELEKNIKNLNKKGYDFFVVDSLIAITNKNDSRSSKAEQVSQIAQRLSKMCLELNIIIITIAQMSKQDLKDKNLAIKNSGDVDYLADIMIYLTDGDDAEDKSSRLIHIKKNRQNGKTATETAYFDFDRIKLVDFKVAYTSEYVAEEQITMGVI